MQPRLSFGACFGISLLLACPAFGEYREAPLQPVGVNRYSAWVSFGSSEQEALYLVDTGAAYSLIPMKTIMELEEGDRAKYVGHDEVRAVDGRKFKAKKYRVAEITVGGCDISDEVVYASPVNQGILGMSTLSRVSPFTLDLEAQVLQLHCRVP